MNSHEIFELCRKQYEKQLKPCNCGSRGIFQRDVDTHEIFVGCCNCDRRTINKRRWRGGEINSLEVTMNSNFKLALDCWNGKEVEGLRIGKNGDELL